MGAVDFCLLLQVFCEGKAKYGGEGQRLRLPLSHPILYLTEQFQKLRDS